MTHQDHETAANIAAARTFEGIPASHHQVPWRSIGDLLASRAAATPDAEWLAFFNDQSGAATRLSYAAFAARAARIANALVTRFGVRRGERVATLLYNHSETVAVYMACWMIGATVAPQNSGEDDQRIGFILRNAEARVLITWPEYLERVSTIRADAPELAHIVAIDSDWEAMLAEQPESFVPAEAPTLDDEALLVYTSGTTGAPKGVQLAHYNLLVDAEGIRRWQRLEDGTRMMCILPIHHVNGTVVTILTPLLCQGSLVLNRAFSAKTFWARCAEERVNVVSVVPTILQYLCEAGEDVAAYDLTRLRHIICGAGTLAVALVERFVAQFGVRVLHGYGLSETTCYSCFLPVDLADAEYQRWISEYGYPSIGVPIWPNEMAIHDPEGKALPPGARGEIVVRGHNVMLGYFQRPDANAEAFAHGWFRSGDEGFFHADAQGRPFFFISGRLKELINRGGVKYSPFEIEEVMLRFPGVRVALAIAFPNTWYGEEVGAYIVPDDGASLDAEALLAFCREHMPAAKCPKVVVFGTEIPVTATGKYQRLRLQDHFAAWRETQFR